VTTAWARVGVEAWAKLLDGVEVGENIWLIELDEERFLLSWRAGRVYLTRDFAEQKEQSHA